MRKDTSLDEVSLYLKMIKPSIEKSYHIIKLKQQPIGRLLVESRKIHKRRVSTSALDSNINRSKEYPLEGVKRSFDYVLQESSPRNLLVRRTKAYPKFTAKKLKRESNPQVHTIKFKCLKFQSNLLTQQKEPPLHYIRSYQRKQSKKKLYMNEESEELIEGIKKKLSYRNKSQKRLMSQMQNKISKAVDPKPSGHDESEKIVYVQQVLYGE